MTAGLWLIVGLVSVGVGAIFSSLFYALHELSRNRLDEMSHDLAPPARKRIDAILQDPQGHSVATSLPRVVCHLLAVIAAVFFVTRLRGVEAPQWLEVTLGMFGASLVVWLFGLVIPSSIARHAGEQTIISWSRLVRACYILTRPFRGMVVALDELVSKIAGVPDDPQQAAQDEVLSVVQDAQDQGKFDQFERDTIESVLRFRDKSVQQIMTPRTEMEAMALTDNLGEVTAQIRKTRHSRIPVYEGNPDRIVGIFYVKDLLRWLAGDKSRAGGAFDFRKLLRPALFIPETKTVHEALTDMRHRKVHLAIVADEYGGTAGLVTIEDIVEQIIGDIRDEFEPALDDDGVDISIDHDARTAEVDARLYIREVNTHLKDLGVELPESPDYDTVGGYVTVALGRIPQPGEVVKVDDVQVTILQGEPTHVERLRLEPAPAEGGDIAAAADSIAAPQ